MLVNSLKSSSSIQQDEDKANASSHKIYSEIPFKDFRFFLDRKGTSTECRNYYCLGEDESIILIFISYTTIAWPTSIQISVLYYNKEQDINVLESESWSASKLTLSKDGHHLTVGSFVLEGNAGEEGVTSIKYKSSKSSGIQLKLRITPTQLPYQLLDGTFYYGPSVKEGTLLNQYFPSCKAHARITVGTVGREFRGKAFSLHILQKSIMPHHAINRTWFTYFVSDDTKTDLCLIDTEASKKFHHRHQKGGHLMLDGKLLGVTMDVNTMDINFGKCEYSGYTIPIEFSFQMSGMTFEGKSFKVGIEVNDQELFGTVDILNKLPMFIRLLVKTFIAKPYLFQWFCKAKMIIEIEDGTKVTVDGKLYHEHSITNQ